MPTVRPWPRRILESQLARPLILIVAVFVLWDVVIRIFKIPPYLIPAPWDVAKMLVAEWPRLWRQSLFTAYATLGGFGLFAWAAAVLHSGAWAGALAVPLVAWLVVLLPWYHEFRIRTPSQHQRGMYRALGAWAVTDVVVVLAWGT